MIQGPGGGMATGERRKRTRPDAEPVPLHAFACNHCHEAKARCSGQIPCTRCAERCLPCRPRQVKKSGRRSRAEVEAERQWALQPQPHPPPPSQSPIPPGQPLLDLVLTQANPKKDAEVFIGCLHQLHKEGRIVRPRVVLYLKRLRVLSLLCSGDPSWGIAAALTRILKVSPLEMEDADAAAFHPRPSNATQRAQGTMARLLEESRQLKQSMYFRQHDDGFTPFYMSIPRSTGMVVAFNKPYQDSHLVANNFYDQIVSKRCIAMLATAAAVVPQDREHYIHKQVEYMYTDIKESRDIIKAFLNDGQVRLYYIRARRVMVDGEEATTVLIEPVPKSRHITDQPGTYHTVVRKYRHYGNAQQQQQEQGAAHAQTGPSSLPSLFAWGGEAPRSAAGPAAASTTAAPATMPVMCMVPARFPRMAALPLNAPPPPAGEAAQSRSDDYVRFARVFPCQQPMAAAIAPTRTLPPLPTLPSTLAHGAYQAAPPAYSGGGMGPAPTQSPHRVGGGSCPLPPPPVLDPDMLSELLEWLNDGDT